MKIFSLVVLIAGTLCAQAPTAPAAGESQPIFRVTVVERTTNAVSYRHRSGWTRWICAARRWLPMPLATPM